MDTPGGVIDAGELLVDGLTREVEEETGLVVAAWRGPAYEVVVEAPDLGWRLRVEVHMASSFRGEMRLADPDGIVVEAGFVAPEECAARCAGGHPWVVEPLAAWIEDRWSEPRAFGYRVEGRDLASSRITRL